MAQIIINNKSIIGQSVTIRNGVVIVDGNDVTPSGKTINIEIIGEVKDLTIDHCNELSINGIVGSVQNGSGDINITGNVTEWVKSGSGDVTIGGGVGSSVTTGSGDVDCNGNILGGAKTGSGDIKYKK